MGDFNRGGQGGSRGGHGGGRDRRGSGRGGSRGGRDSDRGGHDGGFHGGGGGGHGGGFHGGGGFRPPREMHKAVCAECGQECEVPFKPSGEKPVFCRDCFRKKREQY